MADVRAWIPCNIPASAGREAVSCLQVLISGDGKVWEAKGLQRRIVAEDSSCFGAYLAIRAELGNQAAALPAHNEKRRARGEKPEVLFEWVRSASIASHQRFEQAEHGLALMTQVTVLGGPVHAIVRQSEEGWEAYTLENCVTSDDYKDNVSAAFTSLTRALQKVLSKTPRFFRHYSAAPDELWAVCNSPGLETFGRPIPARLAA